MNTNEVTAVKVTTQADLETAYTIRHEVFVIGQQVPSGLEMENNEHATHFLATINGKPAGAARWRLTENGYKLERFAVLSPYRGLGVGQALLRAVLNDLPNDGTTVYLNSQTQAMGLYLKYNFKTQGPEFEEAGIKHYKMVLER